ncbi:MAG: CGLD27 family protein [Merismopedia sp. SIO2A8]|nr:CGLD27 family protein [Merismopedia sp. SIO2A8]
MSTTLVCPVPLEQQPVQEYQELKQSWFYGWALVSGFKFLKPLIIVWGLSWLISAPIATASFPMAKEPLHFGLSAGAGAFVIPMLLLVRLYFGWTYIRDRLMQDTIVYEESGWYDGQTWKKTEEVLQRDRLIASYDVMPMLARLRKAVGGLLGVVGAGALVWIVVG